MQDVLAEAWREYRHNFKTGLAFLLLLVFVLPFLYLHGFFFSSGSVFADYDFAKLGVAELVVSLLALLAFLFAYSVFLTLTVFAVRKRYSAVKVHYFLSEQIHKFAFKVFAYLVIVLAAAWLLGWVWLSLGLPMAWLSVLLFLFSVALMFVPQAIVIDEQDLPTSIERGIEFEAKHKKDLATVLATGFGLTMALVGVEFVVDYYFFVGRYSALVLSLLFVMPFFEVLKSILYLRKFELVRRAYHAHKPRHHKSR